MNDTQNVDPVLGFRLVATVLGILLASFAMSALALRRADHPSQHTGKPAAAQYACKLVKR
jgi:hypothetical protein